MAANISNLQSSPAMSMDAVFVMAYFEELKELRRTWSEPENGVDETRFGMQIDFLIRLIPDRDTQAKIQEERFKLQEEFKQKKYDHYIERAGLCVVTYMIEFLCSSFDLLHVDITGPATSKQYRDAIVEVPDLLSDEQLKELGPMPVSDMDPVQNPEPKPDQTPEIPLQV